MRTHLVLATLATLAGVAGCAADSPTESPKLTDTGVRVINGFDTPVDVVIDGAVARAGLGAGELGSFGTAAGDRSVQVRLAGGTVAALAVRVGTGHLSAVAATRRIGRATWLAFLLAALLLLADALVTVRYLRLFPGS